MPLLSHYFIRLLVALLSGASATLAFAPYSLWPFAFIAPLILLLLMHKQTTKKATWLGFVWGLGYFGAGVSWVHVSIDNFGGMPVAASLFLMIGLISYLSLYPMLFSFLLQRFFSNHNITKYLLAAPALWIITDWLRGWVFTGFPWLWLGYSQIDSPLSAWGPILGVEGITIMILLSVGTIAYSFLEKKWSLLLIPAVILATSFAIKPFDWVTPQADKATKVALIQGNINQAIKWLPSERWPTIMKYMDLTRKNWDADVIVWPEAAIPALEVEIPSFLRNLDSAASMNNSTVITGIVGQSPTGNFYNNIISLGVNGTNGYDYGQQPRYSKHHLLPFGEFVPFENLLRPIAPIFNLPMSSFSRGDYIQPNMEASGTHLAPALCYEIVYGEQVRENITPQTDYILTLSNDAWFGTSIGPLQHMEMAQMRALEIGKPVIRSTNNGVTAITDHKGHITKQIPQFTTAVLRGEVIPTTGTTPYRYWGSIPLYLLVGLFLLVAWRKRKDNM
ncbi:apolipoprotein N-acyltransferase [Aliivibrio fischeri]|uniref:apolipoprotein N-acyltransferase n=1 Tax=Aliivibrio fischeri TaxID=668 RepID=UPI0012D9C38E|nr:apolipoprotein N-acyltransferase [Aliivibrio fischeri]MUH98667.1 apolipoprotein N-acyltransferase [Aliivibrio fischeri]MUI65857.1 apolipoprotein N-acyltransferase [Aliivibrio fischeri]